MICKKCGSYNTDDKSFCTNCGESLSMSNSFDQPMNQNNFGGYNNYGQNQSPAQDPGKGMSIASLVLGIVSFLCFPAITGALGIIFGIVAKNKGSKSGMATAGIICGAIGVALWIIMLIVGNSLMEMLTSYMY